MHAGIALAMLFDNGFCRALWRPEGNVEFCGVLAKGAPSLPVRPPVSLATESRWRVMARSSGGQCEHARPSSGLDDAFQG
jgi:hypothetical protein